MLRAELRGALFIAAMALLAGLAAVYLTWRVPVLPLVQSLSFHIAAALILTAIALALCGGWRRGLALVLLAGLSIGEGALAIAERNGTRSETPAGAAIRVLHFNMDGDNDANGGAIAQMVLASGADIAVLLEAGPIAPHLEALAARFPHRVGCDAPETCDLTLLSRFPLTNIRVESLSRFAPNRAIIATADVDGRALAVAAVHLTKAYFDDTPHNETEALARLLETVTDPLIVTGDFNAAPWSYNLDHLQDWAKLTPPPAYPATWPPRFGIAGIPIDSAFSRIAVITEITAMAETFGSNHRALLAGVALP